MRNNHSTMARLGLLVTTAMLISACSTTPDAPLPRPDPIPAPPPPPPPPSPPPLIPDRNSGMTPDDWEELGGTPTTGSPAPGAGREALRNRSAGRAQDFLPYIDVAIEPDILVSGIGPQLQDRYTRLQIVTLDPDSYDIEGVASGGRKSKDDTRNYDRESRNWFQRTISGSRNVTRTLLAEFDISSPDIKTSKALFSSTFESDNAKGEAWTTNESISVYATPYFKVSPNTTIEGRFRMQLSDERQSSAGANVMSALQTAANLIAPTSALVTYFNAPAMQQASSFLNSQSTALFGQSITEQSTGAFAIRSWTDEPILIVNASMPPAGNIKDTARKMGVGKWAIYLDEPIPSVLTARTFGTGEPDYAGVSSADVLAFQIGADLRVYDYIFSRLDMSDRIASLNENADPDTARVICTRISRGLSEIGFTTFDAAAGVWAASESDQFNTAARQALQDAATCEAMTLWQFINGG